MSLPGFVSASVRSGAKYFLVISPKQRFANEIILRLRLKNSGVSPAFLGCELKIKLYKK